MRIADAEARAGHLPARTRARMHADGPRGPMPHAMCVVHPLPLDPAAKAGTRSPPALPNASPHASRAISPASGTASPRSRSSRPAGAIRFRSRASSRPPYARAATPVPRLYLCGEDAEPLPAPSGRAGRFAARFAIGDGSRHDPCAPRPSMPAPPTRTGAMRWVERGGFTLSARYDDTEGEAMAARFGAAVADISWRMRAARRRRGRVRAFLSRLTDARRGARSSPGRRPARCGSATGARCAGIGELARHRRPQFPPRRRSVRRRLDRGGGGGLRRPARPTLPAERAGLRSSGPMRMRFSASRGSMPADLAPGRFRKFFWGGLDVTLARIAGGYELWCAADDALLAWDRVMRRPCRLRGASGGDSRRWTSSISKAASSQPGRDFVARGASLRARTRAGRARACASFIDADHAGFNGAAALGPRGRKTRWSGSNWAIAHGGGRRGASPSGPARRSCALLPPFSGAWPRHRAWPPSSGRRPRRAQRSRSATEIPPRSGSRPCPFCRLQVHFPPRSRLGPPRSRKRASDGRPRRRACRARRPRRPQCGRPPRRAPHAQDAHRRPPHAGRPGRGRGCGAGRVPARLGPCPALAVRAAPNSRPGFTGWCSTSATTGSASANRGRSTRRRRWPIPRPGPMPGSCRPRWPAHIEAALAALPERQRAAILLCHLGECGNIEAAEIMGISVEALESLLARGRRTLRSRLEPLKESLEDE